MALTNTPHDALMKFVFSDPARAAELLSAFLPEDIARRIDWTRLKPWPTVSVDLEQDRLRELRSDLIFESTFDGRPLALYLLLEHKSQAREEDLTTLYLLGGAWRIWRGFKQQHREAKRLPAILPILISHVPGGWKEPLEMHELIDLDPAGLSLLGPHQPSFCPQLIDLSGVEEGWLRAQAMSAVVKLAVFCLSRARSSRDFVAELFRSVDLAREVLGAPHGVAALRAILLYISQVADAPRERVEHFVLQLGPAGQEAYMTIAQVLREEGRKEGRADLLLKQLAVKFGPLSEQTVARVQSAKLEELDQWAERVLSATTLEEVLGPNGAGSA